MHVVEIIQKKRDKTPLTQQEIDYLITNYVHGNIPDYQMAAFLMATCINGMNDHETSHLTMAMLHSGEVINHKDHSKPIIDKHSTGGVGDKITIPLAPIVASCGLRMPSIAGRGLGHTGGTLDKLESIKGFRTNLTLIEYRDQVLKIGCAIMGQTQDIAPADKLLYALRDVTGTVPSIPLISASIMSKKLAEGIDGLVLDVKYGKGAFMRDAEKAQALAQAMVAIGANMGKKVTAYITNMDQPLGNYLGNALEIIESIELLKGEGPKDSTWLTIELGAEMLFLGNLVGTVEEGRLLIEKSIKSGQAFKKFIEMVKAQGGDELYIYEPHRLMTASQIIEITAKEAGFIHELDCLSFGMAINVLGGGRTKITDAVNHGVGIKMHAKLGNYVEQGQPICTIYADQKGVLEAKERIEQAISIRPDPALTPSLCFDKISSYIA